MSVRLALCAIALAACSTDQPRQAPRVSVVDKVAEPPPDRSLGDGFEMRGIIREDRVLFVPIIATGAIPSTRYVTLARGISSGNVVVQEMPAGLVVDKLRIANHSELPLFALQGELVLGGQQDRVLGESAVIAPGESTTIEVRCVELHRASGQMRFKTGGPLAELSLRREIRHGNQAGVWST